PLPFSFLPFLFPPQFIHSLICATDLAQRHEHVESTAFTESARLVLNPPAEAATVVAGVVIVDGENQPAVGGGRKGQLTADQKGLRGLTVRQAKVADQRARTRGRHRLSADDGA